MSNTTVTTIELELNTATEYTTTAATADTANLAEVFDLDMPKDGRCIVIINNVSGVNGTVTWSLAAGDFWASTAALTGSIAQGKSYILQVDSARFKQSDGKMNLTITPASGKKLKTDHALTIQTIKLAA
jgi:hypothetical protein